MARPRTVSDHAILDAAAAAVAESGPAAVTLAQIGGRAGVTAGALSQRFGSKRELLLALARRESETLPARLAAAPDAAALIELFAALAGGISGPAEFANHLQFLLLDVADPDFCEVTRGYAGAVERAIAGVLGSTDPELPRAVHAAYNGALITWGMTGDGSPADAVRSQLRRLLAGYPGA
ncbi:AcrR family transcriptional regulator [Actinoplanes octamycinicus]|uniref:AcrR family transcriptional regulator n=1 Tax=Actinoplanes octamycinicus TaxID=135948 RepID=A0A7W7M8R9_9ACTN|nr:TetR/AcrR family transcriptional regulator [Actinoplanes octamycinicus]MBB4741090.1 AcrR family transcriptional regulator [Actinoplanes octamycinicus]GIE55995.1 TetR family transcriptional regulator [Actinoplanes octamycinicus]